MHTRIYINISILTTDIWGISSIGRVRRSQRRGSGIETRILHLFEYFPSARSKAKRVAEVLTAPIRGIFYRSARLRRIQKRLALAFTFQATAPPVPFLGALIKLQELRCVKRGLLYTTRLPLHKRRFVSHSALPCQRYGTNGSFSKPPPPPRRCIVD